MEEGDFPTMHELDYTISNMHDKLSLEATVLENRSRKLKAQASKLASQRAFIREERRRVRRKAAMLRDEKERFELTKQNGWFPSTSFPPAKMIRVKVNVGGQLFEISQALASKDPNSLLAAISSTDSPLATDDAGIFYVDRDWWAFRHVLSFLRDGMLPRDTPTLQMLYEEADFWRLQSLQRAIEERNLRMYRREVKEVKGGDKSATTASNSNSASRYEVVQMEEGWWARPPSWWAAAKEPVPAPPPKEEKKKKEEGKKESNKKKDWWEGSKYNGVDFTLSQSETAVTTAPGASDALPVPASVWTRPYVGPAKKSEG